MLPEAIRSRLAEEHDRLLHMLEGIEDLTLRFEKGEEGLGGELRDDAVALFEVFAAHLTFEDASLVPVLRESDVPAADRLAREHEEQRGLLVYLIGRLEQNAQLSTIVCRELRHFADYVRLDMAHENEKFVHP